MEKVWDMARYVVAFEQWVRDEKIAFVASHYDGFAKGVAGKLDSMLIPAFSMLIKQGTACAVEGDIKVAMAMSILKTIAGCGQLSEMYSIDFNEDICIIGHSGSGDADISTARKPTMKIVPVFHGKTGGGYLTQFYPPVGDVTYLAITQDKDATSSLSWPRASTSPARSSPSVTRTCAPASAAVRVSSATAGAKPAPPTTWPLPPATTSTRF